MQFFYAKKNIILLTFFIILTSLIYGLPHIILTSKLGASYTPFSLSPKSPIAADETYGYAGFANYIYKGNFFLRDAYVYEYRNFPTPLIADNIPALAFAFLAKITGSLARAYIVSDFIFPAIIFLIIYLFLKMFINNTYYAISVAFVTTIARDLISVIPFPQATFKYLTFAEYQDTFLHLSRSPHPQFSFLVLLGAVWSLVHLITKPKSNVIIPGLLFGLLFYTYMFYFSYFSLFFALIFLFFIFKKDIFIVKKLFLVGLIAALLGSYYFWNVFNFYQTDLTVDFAEKMSRPQFTVPLTILRYLVVALLLFFTSRKKDNKTYGLVFFIIAGVIIIPLIKIISSRDFETFHYVRFALMPFATMAFFISIYHLIAKNVRLIFAVATVTIIISLYLGFKTQVVASLNVAPYQVINVDQKNVFDWFKKNTNKNDVVGSLNDDFNRFASVYTDNWVYFPFTSRTIMPTYESGYRYIILSHLLGISTQSQKSDLDYWMGYIFRFRSYNNFNDLDKHSIHRSWLEGEISRLSNKDDFNKIRNNYKLNYVVITPDELQYTSPDFKFLTPITSINEYIIFKYDPLGSLQ